MGPWVEIEDALRRGGSGRFVEDWRRTGEVGFGLMTVGEVPSSGSWVEEEVEVEVEEEWSEEVSSNSYEAWEGYVSEEESGRGARGASELRAKRTTKSSQVNSPGTFPTPSPSSPLLPFFFPISNSATISYTLIHSSATSSTTPRKKRQKRKTYLHNQIQPSPQLTKRSTSRTLPQSLFNNLQSIRFKLLQYD